ncbi:MAG: aminotransferase class V-fold PLP-dependent enzyme, partial [Lachnospiraceae bacterium]|nr:aminotransferase class V-fold PLP-dependent enzyme [Lachnospiraceae bacterium]
QERGLRSGTLNVPGIVGMGVAARLAMERMEQDHAHITELRALMIEELKKNGCEFVLNAGDEKECRANPAGNNADMYMRGNTAGITVPQILNIGFKGIEGSSLLIELDMKGIICSTGSACAASSAEPSHVLTAAGIDKELIRGSLRLSFSRYNTADEVAEAASVIAKSVERLKKLNGYEL